MEPQAQSVDILPLESMVPAVTTERTRVAATEMVLSPAKTL